MGCLRTTERKINIFLRPLGPVAQFSMFQKVHEHSLFGYLFLPSDIVIMVDARGHVLPHKERMEGETSRVLQELCNRKMPRCEHRPPGYQENTHDP